MTLIHGIEFPNALIMEQYYASKGRLFGAFIKTPAVSGGGLVGAWMNPANSGTVLVLFRIFGSANTNGERTRYRVGPQIANSNVQIPASMTPAAVVNRTGLNTAAKGRLYANGLGLIASGGVAEKSMFLAANSADPSYENGSIELRPGDSQYWMFTPDQLTATKSIALEVVWGERSL